MAASDRKTEPYQSIPIPADFNRVSLTCPVGDQSTFIGEECAFLSYNPTQTHVTLFFEPPCVLEFKDTPKKIISLSKNQFAIVFHDGIAIWNCKNSYVKQSGNLVTFLQDLSITSITQAKMSQDNMYLLLMAKAEKPGSIPNFSLEVEYAIVMDIQKKKILVQHEIAGDQLILCMDMVKPSQLIFKMTPVCSEISGQEHLKLADIDSEAGLDFHETSMLTRPIGRSRQVFAWKDHCITVGRREEESELEHIEAWELEDNQLIYRGTLHTFDPKKEDAVRFCRPLVGSLVFKNEVERLVEYDLERECVRDLQSYTATERLPVEKHMSDIFILPGQRLGILFILEKSNSILICDLASDEANQQTKKIQETFDEINKTMPSGIVSLIVDFNRGLYPASALEEKVSSKLRLSPHHLRR